MTDREYYEMCAQLIFGCRLYLAQHRDAPAHTKAELQQVIRKNERRLRALGDPFEFDDDALDIEPEVEQDDSSEVPPSAEGAVRPRGVFDDRDEWAAGYFRKELDEWGSPSKWTGRYEDPFLHAVVRSAEIPLGPLQALTAAYSTLDDLLAASRSEVAKVRGVGSKTLALLEAELQRLGYRSKHEA